MVFFGCVVDGDTDACDVLAQGLSRLANVGSDSSGVATADGGALHIRKKGGKAHDLLSFLKQAPAPGVMGISHLRWATHGKPDDKNAHPFVSNNGNIALVHNGVIENERTLRAQLLAKGYSFESETDSEVLVNLVQDTMTSNECSLEEAIPVALAMVSGAYGVMLMSAQENVVIACQSGSSLMFGSHEKSAFIASNVQAFPEDLESIQVVREGEYVRVGQSGKVETRYFPNALSRESLDATTVLLKNVRSAMQSKDGHPDFIIKDISEVPMAVENCLKGRSRDGEVTLLGLNEKVDGTSLIGHMSKASRLIIIGSGSSYNAAMAGKYFIEAYGRVNVQVEFAAEFRSEDYSMSLSGSRRDRPVLIAISQSGETGDTIACVKAAKSAGVPTFGVCNQPNSTIATLTDSGAFIRAGEELGVVSTKTFACEVVLMQLLAIAIGRHKNVLPNEESRSLLGKLMDVPTLQQKFIDESRSEVARIARTYKYASNFLYLGRGFNFPIVREGALKLTQVPYIHCEAYPAAEMKHGPIALIDEFMPVLFIAMKDAVYEKVISNMREVQARKGAVIAITDRDNHELDGICDYVIRLDSSDNFQLALLTLVPLQLLAYELGVARKCDVDHPRHQTRSFINDTGSRKASKYGATGCWSPPSPMANKQLIQGTPRGETDFSGRPAVLTLKQSMEERA